MKETIFTEFLDWELEPEINIEAGNFAVIIRNNEIFIDADITDCVGRVSDYCSIPLDKFIDACNRLKAEVESRSNMAANKVIHPTT